MMIFSRRAPSLIPGFPPRMPNIPVTIQTRYFFDRTAVKNALSNLEYQGCMKSSVLVKTVAVRSIKQKGNARPPLKIMRDNPGLSLQMLRNTPNLRNHTAKALQVRISEIQFPPSSPPGTPPFTHVHKKHGLGFRRNLYNAMDPGMTSAVVGPAKRGVDWGIPHLHEFGGNKTLLEFSYVPTQQQANQWSRGKTRALRAYTKWTTPYEPPGGQWAATGRTKSAAYPARPFMLPALTKSLPRIAKMFEGKFSASRFGG